MGNVLYNPNLPDMNECGENSGGKSIPDNASHIINLVPKLTKYC